MRLRDSLLTDLLGCSRLALRKLLPFYHLAGGWQGLDSLLPRLASADAGERRLDVLRDALLRAAVGRFLSQGGLPDGTQFLVCLDGWRPYPRFRDHRFDAAFVHWARPILDAAGYASLSRQ